LTRTLIILIGFYVLAGNRSPALAQVVLEPLVKTDTVDVFAAAESNTGKSRGLAMISSLILPGLGHQYLQQDRRALAHFSSEAFFIFGLVFCERYSKKFLGDARAYAYTYADVRASSAADDYFWKVVGNFMDSDEYNRIPELNRSPDEKYLGDDQQWRWIDESYLKRYRTLRQDATSFHVASSFFIAAMVLDRVVAFVDVRRSMRQKSITGKTTIEAQPVFALTPSTAQIGLRGTF
jgi:hypothetical protein